jgi:beta-lactamase superfamily II metal-dependent hydrolase
MLRLIFAVALTLFAEKGSYPFSEKGYDPFSETLDIYFIDVEGGQATLIVTPAGQSLLVDGGWAGGDNRDPRRVLAAARAAGITQIDYLLVTHFHGDHIGAIPELAKLIPIKTFVDYGKPIERGLDVVVPYTAYAVARNGGSHLVPKPGDRLPLEGAEVTVLTAGGTALSTAVDGAGEPTPGCGTLAPRREDRSENRRSIGIRVRFGAFRFIDLGDLGWNALMRLVCPNNLIGTAALFLMPHHSSSDAGVPALVRAVDARAIVSNNGATKGGAADTFAMLHRHRGAADVWQLHRSTRRGAENFPAEMIANADAADTGFWIKVSAMSDGSFTAANARNGFVKSYR